MCAFMYTTDKKGYPEITTVKLVLHILVQNGLAPKPSKYFEFDASPAWSVKDEKKCNF